MTDEEITDALWDCSGGYSPQGVAVQRQIAALRARIDELHDQRHAEARKADALLETLTIEDNRHFDRMSVLRHERDAERAEKERLGRVIVEAPHAYGCRRGDFYELLCDCWKSRAPR